MPSEDSSVGSIGRGLFRSDSELFRLAWPLLLMTRPELVRWRWIWDLLPLQTPKSRLHFMEVRFASMEASQRERERDLVGDKASGDCCERIRAGK